MRILNQVVVFFGFIALTGTVFAQSIAGDNGDRDSDHQNNGRYETVIRSTRFRSASRVVLDEKMIRQSKAPNLTSLLATQANISVSSSNFQPGSIYLRGGDSSHVLVLVDGLPFYDATTTQRTLNLNEFDIKTIRRIEIIKGSQSVLYGGQALSGVIQIETLPVEIEKRTSLTAEGGQRDYKKSSVALAMPISEENVSLLRIQAGSKASRSPVLDSPQTYRSELLGADLGWVHQSDWNSFLKLSQIYDRNEITNSDFNPATMTTRYFAVDTQGFDATNRIHSLSSGVVFKNSPLRPKLLAGFQKSNRSFIEDLQSNEKYDGDLLNVRAEIRPVTGNAQTLLGASFLEEKMSSSSNGLSTDKSTLDQKGLFAKTGWDVVPEARLEAGLRGDFYQNKAISSYQAGLSLWDSLRLEVSTGFKAPSLFQLFNKTYGNPDLREEKSRTFSLDSTIDVGVDANLSLSVFQTNFENLIASQNKPGTGNQFYNVARAETRGFEIQIAKAMTSFAKVDLAFGYQEPKDLETGNWLLRRPLQSGSLKWTYDKERIRTGYELIYNGERIDRFQSSFITGQSETGSLPSYLISNAFLNYELSQDLTIYFRGNNIWNQRYEQSRGYHDEGTFWLAGLEYSR